MRTHGRGQISLNFAHGPLPVSQVLPGIFLTRFQANHIDAPSATGTLHKIGLRKPVSIEEYVENMTEMPFSPQDDRLAEEIEGEVEVVPDEERLVDEPDPEPGDVLDEDRPVHTEDPTN